MLISVIIPTYNRLNQVCLAIDSVLSQTYKNFELIVVDDGSTDSTYFFLKKKFGNQINLFYQDNKGVSAARNFGILKSKGDWICFLDSDDIWLKHKLEKQIKHLIYNKLKISQSNEIWYRNCIRVNPTRRNLKQSGNLFTISLKLCLITISSVIISRDIFDKYGFFDENMLVCEDYDLWLRITQNEKVGLLEENLLIRYGGHLDQLSKKFSVIDRFRLYSLLKFYSLYYEKLSFKKKDLVLSEILLKWDFIKKGRKKRKHDFKYIEELIETIIFKNQILELNKVKKYLIDDFKLD